MIEQLNVTPTIGVESLRAWQAISRIGGLERWFPIIAACTVTGSGEGAVRHMTLADGGEIQDRIDLIDHAAQTLKYTRFESPFPVRSYQGIVEVRDAGPGKTTLSWTVVIDVDQEHRQSLGELITKALSDGVKGLEQDLQRQQQAQQ